MEFTFYVIEIADFGILSQSNCYCLFRSATITLGVSFCTICIRSGRCNTLLGIRCSCHVNTTAINLRAGSVVGEVIGVLQVICKLSSGLSFACYDIGSVSEGSVCHDAAVLNSCREFCPILDQCRLSFVTLLIRDLVQGFSLSIRIVLEGFRYILAVYRLSVRLLRLLLGLLLGSRLLLGGLLLLRLTS